MNVAWRAETVKKSAFLLVFVVEICEIFRMRGFMGNELLHLRFFLIIIDFYLLLKGVFSCENEAVCPGSGDGIYQILSRFSSGPHLSQALPGLPSGPSARKDAHLSAMPGAHPLRPGSGLFQMRQTAVG
jgi:hypothetical protein